MCYCGASDCPSCGPAQGYNVLRDPIGRHYNPACCAECGEEAFHPDELDAAGNCPECVEKIAEREAEENRPDVFELVMTGQQALITEFFLSSGRRYGELNPNDPSVYQVLLAGRHLDATDQIPAGGHWYSENCHAIYGSIGTR